jgi:cytochrome c oxidase subunit 2
MSPGRRQLLAAAGASAFAVLVGYARGEDEERVVRITASRFRYEPTQITLKRGERVVLELVSNDVTMGFNAPDFGVRTDIVPGTVARVPIQPDKVGTFLYHCDIFCGDGHEDMSGTIQVVA